MSPDEIDERLAAMAEDAYREPNLIKIEGWGGAWKLSLFGLDLAKVWRWICDKRKGIS